MQSTLQAREMMRTIRMMTLILFSLGVAGCAPRATPAVASPIPTSPPLPTPTIPVQATQPSGWETFTNQQGCAYTISHPPEMEGLSQDANSWLLSPADAPDLISNFIYVSVIPADFQPGVDEIIYNYDPAEAQALSSMQVGESRSVREDPAMAEWFTYTRLPDTLLVDGAAQTYENARPWEFPEGTKEIRHYLQTEGCTYLIGGYLDAAGSGQPGTITEALFDEIVASFHLNP